MKNKDKNTKLHKAVKGTSIAIKVVFVLCGIAITLFFAWLGLSIYSWLAV